MFRYISVPPVGHTVHNFGTVLCWIDMNAERTLTEWHVYYTCDRLGDIGDISIGRRCSGEALHDVVSTMGIRTVVVFRLTLFVFRCAGMCKVVCSSKERSRYDDRCLNAPPVEFGSVAYRQRIHGSFGGKVRSEIGRSSTACATAAHPENKTSLLFPELREGSPVHALGAQHIGVINLCKLLRREGFRCSEYHVPGVVYN